MKTKNTRYGIFAFYDDFTNNQQNAINDQMKLIQYTDKIGLDEAYVAEHHFNSYSLCPNPSVLLSYLASSTKNIKLGTAGYLAPFHDPIRLAEDIAMVDNLSGGRVILGFAKGAFAPDIKHFKIQPEQLRDAMFENVDGIDGLLKGKIKDFDGKFINFSNVEIEPKPLQKSIPISIATFASKESIEYAAKNGYGLMAAPGVSLDECENMVNIYEEIAGKKPTITIARKFYLHTNKKFAQTEAKITIDHFTGSMQAASSYQKAPIFDKEKYKDLVEERETFFNGEKFYDTGIIGDVEDCKNEINKIKERFDDVTILLKPLGRDYQANMEMFKLFSEYIL